MRTVGTDIGTPSAKVGSQIIVANGAEIEIPNAQFLFSAEFSRVGEDLVLTGEDGTQIIILGYFSSDALAQLVAPNGAYISGETVELLAGPQFPAQFAQAAAPTGAQPIGQVETLTGTATATRQNGTVVQLNIGDPVFQGDVIQTGAGSTLGLVFADASIFSVSANGRMVLNEFVYQAGGSNNSMLTDLIEGTFVFVAGQIAPTGDMKIDTPVSTVGIRGTTIVFKVSTTAGNAELVLTNDRDGTAGEFQVYLKGTNTLIATISETNVVNIMDSPSASMDQRPWSSAEAAAADPALQNAFTAAVSLEARLGAGGQAVEGRSDDPGQDGQPDPDAPPDGSEPTLEPGIAPDPIIFAPPGQTQVLPQLVPPPKSLDGSDADGTGPVESAPEIVAEAANGVPVADPPPPPPPPPAPGTADAQNDAVTTNENSVVSGNVLADNGSGEDTGNVIVTQVEGVAVNEDPALVTSVVVTSVNNREGVLTLNAEGVFDFDPQGNFDDLGVGDSDTVMANYTVEDDASNFDIATITLTINGVNDDPTANVVIDDQTATEDEAFELTILPNSFSDVDGDALTLSASVGGAAPLPGWLNFDGNTGTFSGTPGNGDVGPISVALEAFDGNGGITAILFDLDVLNVNDAPVIGAAITAGAVTEIADNAAGENVDDLTDTGTIAFTDVDLTDAHTVSVTPQGGGVGFRGVLAALVTDPSTNDGAGTVTWTFTVNDSAIDNLAAGQTLIQAYDVTIDDGNGGTAAETVTITITGTNDAPVIGVADTAGAVTEIADNAVGENVDDLTDTGTIAFTDVDLTDAHTVSVTPQGGGVGFRGALTPVISNISTNDGAGTVTWTFTVNDSAIDNLAAGQTLIQAYDVTIDDGNGGTATETVTITITGTNDAPVIGVADTAGAVTEIADGAAGENGTLLSDSGTIAFTDVDLADGHTVSATLVSATDSVNGAVAARGTLTPVISNVSTGDGAGEVTWTFAVQDAALDDLAAGQTLTQIYDVTVDDGNGGTATETVTITITGTNDAPVADRIGEPPLPLITVSEDDLPVIIGDDAVVTVDLLTDANADDVDLTDILTVQNTPASITTVGNRVLNAGTHYTVSGPTNSTFILTLAGIALFNDLAEGATDTITVNYDISDGTTSIQNSLTITVTGANDAPVVDQGIAIQTATIDAPFGFTIPGDAFNDVDIGDVLIFTAELDNGDPLPAWLSFVNGTFSGTPAISDGGLFFVTVTATDIGGLTAEETFALEVGIIGTAGNDILTGTPASEFIDGLDGNDTLDLSLAVAGVNVDLSAGTASGPDIGNDIIANIENVIGGSGDDTLIGDIGPNILTGGAGDDVVIGGGGDDTLDGGADTDTLVYSATTQGVDVDLVAGIATGPEIGTDTVSNFENVLGGVGNDLIVGDEFDNVLDGGDGRNTLIGGLGDDILRGGDRGLIFLNDANIVDYSARTEAISVELSGPVNQDKSKVTFDGSAETDTLINISAVFGTNQADTFSVVSSYENIFSGGPFVLFEGLGGDDVFVGEGGFDTGVQYTRAEAGVTVTLSLSNGQAISTEDVGIGNPVERTDLANIGVDTIFLVTTIRGSAFDDVLTVDDLLLLPFGTFRGNAGDDFIDGGGAPNIRADYANSPNGITVTPTGTKGSFTVEDGFIDPDSIDPINDPFHTDTLVRVQRIRGSEHDDFITMDDANNEVRPRGGDDIVDGGDGIDRIRYSTSKLGVTIDLANETATGVEIGNDSIVNFENAMGGSGNDTLIGDAGPNRLEGLDGRNLFIGGAGNDDIRGSTHADPVNIAAGVLGGLDTVSYDGRVESISVIMQGPLNSSGSTVTVDTSPSPGADEVDTLRNIDSVVGTLQADEFVSLESFEGQTGGRFVNFEGLGGDDTFQAFSSARVSYTQALAGVDVDFQRAPHLIGLPEVDDASGTAFSIDPSSPGLPGADLADIGIDTFLGGIQQVTGSAFNDILSGSDFDFFESFRGEAGNDTIDGRGGSRDRADYINSPAGIVVTPVVESPTDIEGTFTVQDGFGTTDSLFGIEIIRGSSFADSITGDFSDNEIRPMQGDDTVDGGDGIDTVRFVFVHPDQTIEVNLATGLAIGTPFGTDASLTIGTNTLFSIENAITGETNDTLIGNDQNNIFNAGAGRNVFVASGGDDTFIGGVRGRSADANFADYSAWDGPIDVVVGAGVDPSLSVVTKFDDTGTLIVGTDSLQTVELVIGTNSADTYAADPAYQAQFGDFNQFEGLGGDDLVIGNGGTRVSYKQAASGVDVDLLRTPDEIGLPAVAGATGTAFSIDPSSPGLPGADLAGIGIDTFRDGIESITGSPNDDILRGTDAATFERFRALAGNDIVDGRGGSADEADYRTSPGGIVVTPTGAIGSFTVADGFGTTDQLSGIEFIRGSEFNDVITGDDGDNRIRPRAGHDTVDGGAGTDTLAYFGGSQGIVADLSVVDADGFTAVQDSFGDFDLVKNIEIIQASDFDDQIIGDANPNIIFGRSGSDFISGGGGIDELSGNDGNDELRGNAQGDFLFGGAGNDVLVGGGGSDEVFGGDGFDFIIEGPGSDFIDGGAGFNDFDTVTYDTPNVTSGITYTGGTGVNGIAVGDAEVVGASSGTDTLTEIERIEGTNFVDVFNGGDANERFDPLGSSDTIDGGGGFDQLAYTDIVPGAGNEGVTITFTSQGAGTATLPDGVTIDNFTSIEAILGSDGDDTITLSAADFDVVFNTPGNDALDGGAGVNDVLDFFDGNQGLNINLATGQVLNNGYGDFGGTAVNFENVSGNAFGDVITGDANANILDGRDGDDDLSGGGGADTLLGGFGDDILEISDAGFSSVDGGGGFDELELNGTFDLDLTAINNANVTGLERIDITGLGDNILTLALSDVLDMNGDVIDGLDVILADAGVAANLNEFLIVQGNLGDTVILETPVVGNEGAWAKEPDTVADPGSNDIFGVFNYFLAVDPLNPFASVAVNEDVVTNF